MIGEVLADRREVDKHVDTQRRQKGRLADARVHEDVGCVDGTRRENDLLLRLKGFKRTWELSATSRFLKSRQTIGSI